MHRAWLPATALIAGLAACAGPAPAPTRAPAPAADGDRAIVDRLRGALSLFTLRGEEQRVAFRRLDELVPVNVVRGMFGQHIEVAPAERVVVAIHSHWAAPVTDELIAHNDAFVTALVDAAAAPRPPPRATGGGRGSD